MKKTMMMLIIGTAIFGMTVLTAVADDEKAPLIREQINDEEIPEIQQITSKTVVHDGNGEPLIAPAPDLTIDHDAEKGERSIDNIVGEDCDQTTPHILDLENEELIVDTSYLSGTTLEEEKETEKNNSQGLEAIITLGVVGTLAIGLIFVYKKQ